MATHRYETLPLACQITSDATRSIPKFCLLYSQSQPIHKYGSAHGHGHRCLGEITVREEQRGDEGPNVQRGGDPLRADAHPDGCPSNIH
jgi:hypothetical protein